MTSFEVGIRFEPLGQASDPTNSRKTVPDSAKDKCHWALVFAFSEIPDLEIRIELDTPDGKQISFPMSNLTGGAHHVRALPLGRCHNVTVADLEHVRDVHPMRGSTYDAAHNNCQHWAATFLIFLEAYCSSPSNDRRFEITNSARYEAVLSVLAQHDDKKSLYHHPNPAMDKINLAPAAVGAGATGLAGFLTGGTTMVASPGVWGYLGYQVAAPTLMASAATVAVPVLAVGAVWSGASYIRGCYAGVKKSLFGDPRVCGCPKTVGKAMTAYERGEAQVGLLCKGKIAAYQRLSREVLDAHAHGERAGKVVAMVFRR
ncbi:hypothetical protein B0H66DRAFT_109772 [Apodospora peruviana]|uniref:Uncharacterized protein n=1 Tax=Apodospora peruviana TaxID=516989 RepID=A0AAE0IH42_9PEZI|nr:hypothetical protein B0H66DRAFT_109772 [Apodospora peruviana]